MLICPRRRAAKPAPVLRDQQPVGMIVGRVMATFARSLRRPGGSPPG